MTNANEPRHLPQHIAIVMDGNGRWAEGRHLPTAAGHKAGVEAVRRVLEVARDRGVRCLTLFAFSSENWQRPALEVKALMTLFSSYLDSEIDELQQKGVRLRFIGRRDRFPKALVNKINKAEHVTSTNTAFDLTLAVDYGGQWDITCAARQVAEKVASGSMTLDDITPESLGHFMSLSGLPPLDLFIRTSGEYRISNFLLWQLAYAELYFTDTLWPDFGERELDDALNSFQLRDRRFGGRKEAASA